MSNKTKIPTLKLMDELDEFSSTKHIKNVELLASELVNNNDQSHKTEHLEKVWLNCLKIASKENIKDPFNLLLLYFGAKFHELFDTKFSYEVSNFTRVISLFQNYISVEHSLIMIEILKTITYKKEKEIGYDALTVNIQKEFILIRNIISDADKLESLNINRAFQYSSYINTGFEYNKIKDEVIQHCHDKLLKLKDNYFRTDYGKILAIPLHNELLKFVNT